MLFSRTIYHEFLFQKSLQCTIEALYDFDFGRVCYFKIGEVNNYSFSLKYCMQALVAWGLLSVCD